MKLTTFILLVTLLHVSAAGFAQKVTYVHKDVTLKQVFDEINKQTGYSILWTAQNVKSDRIINANFRNAPLEEVLKKCLDDQPLTFTIDDKIIVIRQKEQSVLDKIKTALAIPITVSGKIRDEQGNPLPGVTVRIKGSNNATSTNENGVFNIVVPDNNTVLILSFIGFETKELIVKDISNNAVITLTATQMNLKEVVVNKGYYTTRKELETGDVSSVSAKEISEQPVSNPLAALEGRIPGMQVTQNTGMLGGGYTVQIRGKNSILNGNDPLYIIDGVPYISQLTNTGYLPSSVANGSPFNFINPSDIENIDVLKDADATSIYGSRGANGVVLITTKKGKEGTTKVDFNMYSGIGQVTHTANYLNTQQYLQMRHEAFKNDGAQPGSSDFDINGTWDTTRYTNWQKLLLGGTAHYTDAQGTVSGGNANTQYLIGTGYHRETSIFPGDGNDQKASVHFNINNTSPNKKFNIVLSGSFISDNTDNTQNDFTGLATSLPPDAPPIYNPDGTLNWAPLSPGQSGTWSNPYAELLQKYKANTINLVSNAIISYKVLPNLEIKTTMGYNNMQVNVLTTQPLASFDPGQNGSSGTSLFNNTSLHSWIIEPQVNYKVTLGKGNLSVLAGTTFQNNSINGQVINAGGFSSDALITNLQNATNITVNSVVNTQYKYNAIFGRINYDWQEKYLLNITARRDGTSRFGPDKQFANFGAIGAAWIFSKENFFEKNLSFLSFGKLRASYGTTGNDQVGDYRFLDLYSSTKNPYQNTKGLYPANLFNPDLAWEVDKKLEVGLELGFLDNRIYVTSSYYRNRSSNQLLSTPLSAVTGFTSINSNLPATVENSGMEFALTSVNLKQSAFSWTSSFNLTIPRNKLISFPGLSTSVYQYSYIVGQPITIQRVFDYAGIDPNTGYYQFKDINGNLTENPSVPTDYTKIENLAPKFYGGLQNSFQYKRFSLDIFFQFVKQTGYTFLINAFPGYMGYNQPVSVLARWQKSGDISNIQKFSQSDFNVYNGYSNESISNYAYSDASFIRLKNLSLSYLLPISFQQALHIKYCRVFIQGQNLLTITKYVGNDPENQSTTDLPPLRVFTAGFQITL